MVDIDVTKFDWLVGQLYEPGIVSFEEKRRARVTSAQPASSRVQVAGSGTGEGEPAEIVRVPSPSVAPSAMGKLARLNVMPVPEPE